MYDVVLLLSYAVLQCSMETILTVRLDRAQAKALSARAKALGRTRSDLVRALIAQGLETQPLGRRAGHLKGRLKLAASEKGWRRRIKDRNWR